MFYNKENLPADQTEKVYFLITNFLDEAEKITNLIAEKFSDMTHEILDDFDLNLKQIISRTFVTLPQVRRDFVIESVNQSDVLFKKLTDNGLVGDSLNCKLIALDWLWNKARNFFLDLMDGKYNYLFWILLNQLKSILGSILKSLGISTDIYDEAYDLLMSFSIMSNNKI
jgi:hypothetical protein